MSRLTPTGYGARPEPRADEVYETSEIPRTSSGPLLTETRLTLKDRTHPDGKRAILIEGVESVRREEGRWYIEARTGVASTREIPLDEIVGIQGVERRT